MGKYREQFMSEMERLLPGLLDQIEGVWANIGVQPEDCQRRMEHLIQRARTIITKTVEMYDDEYNQLVMNIEQIGKQILALASELGIKTKEPDEQLSVLQLKEFLLNYLEELRSEKSRRLDAFENLTLEKKQLMARLDWPQSDPYCGTVPTHEQLHLLREHVAEMRTEKDRRYCTFSATKGIIVRLFKKLELKPVAQFECDVVNDDDDFPLTISNLDALKTLKEKLEIDLQAKIAETEKLREELIMLWDLLNVPLEEKEVFLANNMGHTLCVILSLKEEISKMEKRKMDNMQALIFSLREEMLIYWKKCLYGANQKEAFRPFYDDVSDTCTDGVLEVHKRYLKNLKELYSECHVVFEKVLKLRDLFQKLIAFVAKQDTNPERFNNRGGRLLKEEKERKMLQIQIPKLESEIQEAVQTWESQHSTRLTVFGQSVPNYLQDQWARYNNEKEKERLERQMKKNRAFEEGSKGVGLSSLGKRTWVPTGSPLAARTNKILKKATPNRKMEPRRLLQKAVQTNPKMTENPIITHPQFNPVEVKDLNAAQHMETSALSTYTQFENKLSNKCRTDIYSRSSTVTPCSPVPGSPRRCRSRLGLPMLI